MDALSTPEILLFGSFRFDRRSKLLFRCGEGDDRYRPVSVGSRALTVLGVLTERPGDLVSRDEIMRVAWPGLTVEEGNLTVQISTLRRILDAGSEGESCIQTVSGRGYRFVRSVTYPGEQSPTAEPAPPDDQFEIATGISAGRESTRSWRWLAVGSGVVTIIALVVAVVWLGGRTGRTVVPPRLSLVVLPFQNLSGDPKDDYLADGITDDLTSDLSHIPGVSVAARESAYTFKGKAVDVRQVGHALGVRYVLEGSARRIEDTLRINVQLTSAESGLHLWSDRFDERIADLNGGQERIVIRMGDQLGISLVEIENARSLRERPTNPDAFDLILRARAIGHLPWSLERNEEKRALFEHALSLDPTSIYAKTGVAYSLTDTAADHGWGRYDDMQRAGRLLTQAQALAPASEVVLNTYVYWLRTVGRCSEIIELAERALRTDPNRMRVQTGIYNELATCKIWAGHAEEALALQAEVDRLNPLSPYKFTRYHQMGKASLLLGRVPEAIGFLERAVAMNPKDLVAFRWLAAAYALAGRTEEATRSLAKANRSWLYDTVRGYATPAGLSPSSVYIAQLRRFQDGLRLAGMRDHADEDANFGVPADSTLHSEVAGHTPVSVPGATTILTAELPRLLAEMHPLVIDAITDTRVPSIPASVGLAFAGLGGSFEDEAQQRLRSKLQELTGDDLNRPIVAVGWNSEHFDGFNLALRLVALGYTRVYWYRGGREAWEVAGLPETEADLQEW
jgi:TolB-like protein/DNA-binding winged helix-turn-helix (wHTH) protein